MSNAIQFLESIGRSTALSGACYAATVAELDIDGDQRRALLERDHATLNELLEGRSKMLFYVNTPSPDDHDAIPDDDKDDDGVPDQDAPPYE